MLGSLCRTTALQTGMKRSQMLRVLAGIPLLFSLRYLTLLEVYNTDPESEVPLPSPASPRLNPPHPLHDFARARAEPVPAR
jgi:hypothetical protein